MNVEECLRRRLLRKIAPSDEKTLSSIKISEIKLDESRRLFVSDFFNSAVISAYTSMFHASRALLYKNGIQEKSHYAVYVYLKEKYSNKIPLSLINSFFNYQNKRHYILYGFSENVKKDEAEAMIFDAEEFLNKIKGILSKNDI